MSMVTRRLIKIPSKYAEELGNDFIISKEKKVIASLGQYFTPQIIAELIAKNFSEVKPANELKILDSGAGSGILSCTLCEQITNWQHKPKHIELTAYEIDNALVPLLKKSFSSLKHWLADKSISLSFSINDKDFVLENADILDKTFQRSLFSEKNFEEFDFIVANPPYFKIPKSDPRAKAASTVIHGQPNIYALFMALAGALLKKRVSLVLSPRVAMRLVFTSNVREAAGIHGLARGGMSPREAGQRSL